MNKFLSKTNLITPLTFILGASSAVCLMLLILRIYLSSSIFYAFFVWNLFLAWIPFILSEVLLKLEKQNTSTITLSSIFFTWLMFFPNSPYILTDLFHLKKVQNIPLWYDLIMIISFAWNGLMIGYISLIRVQTFLNNRFTSKISWSIIIFILCLCAFGIYLGRFERWNSWDIVTNPFDLLSTIFEKIIDPLSHPKTIGVTVFFSLFLIMGYLTLFYLVKSKHES